jgi:ribosomal protein L11 methyltransferase
MLTKLTIHPVPRNSDEAATLLTRYAPQGWEEQPIADAEDGAVRICVYFENPNAAVSLASRLDAALDDARVDMEEVPEQDWNAGWREFFTPVKCGELFTVVPPWMAEVKLTTQHSIVIEPKMAFGTGHHATTALCLEVLSELLKNGRLQPGQTFLDLGTGSGVLGIGLTLCGLTGLGLDIDHQATVCAVENARNNKCSSKFEAATGGIETLTPDKRFDCVVANILSGPLISLSPLIVQRVTEGGCLVLSGILVEQADNVSRAYQRLGLPAPRKTKRDEWVVLAWI